MAPLQPLQQTVFEQGPQTGVPPTAEPAFVYQEGQVILPEPINPVQAIDPGIAWNALGAEAMGIAQKMLTETWDYLIDTKRNAITDLGLTKENELNNIYTALADEEQRIKENPLVYKPVDMAAYRAKIKAVRDGWAEQAKEILGEEDFNRWTGDKVDFKSLGSKWQQLALATKQSQFAVSNQARKIATDLAILNFGNQENRFNFLSDSQKNSIRAANIEADRAVEGITMSFNETVEAAQTMPGAPLDMERVATEYGTQLAAIRSAWETRVKTAVGEENYSKLMDPNLDYSELQPRQQQLALTLQESRAKIEEQMNRTMLSLAKLKVKDNEKQTNIQGWLGNQRMTNEEIRKNVPYAPVRKGTSFIPTDKDGKLISVFYQPGTMQPLVDNKNVPLFVETVGPDGKPAYVLNVYPNQANIGMPQFDINQVPSEVWDTVAIMDMRTVVSPDGTNIHPSALQEWSAAIATGNEKELAMVLSSMRHMPSAQMERHVLRGREGVTEEEASRIAMTFAFAKTGVPANVAANVIKQQGINAPAVFGILDSIDVMQTAPFTISFEGSGRGALSSTAMAQTTMDGIQFTTEALFEHFNVPIPEGYFWDMRVSGEGRVFYEDQGGGESVVTWLQSNPNVKFMIARAVAGAQVIIDAQLQNNPNVFASPEERREAFRQAVKDIVKADAITTGLTFGPNGLVAFAPGAKTVETLMQERDSAFSVAGVSIEDQKTRAKDSIQDRWKEAAATGLRQNLYSGVTTNDSTEVSRTKHLEFMRRFGGGRVDMATAEFLYDLMIETKPDANGNLTTQPLSDGVLLQIAVASIPSVWSNYGYRGNLENQTETFQAAATSLSLEEKVMFASTAFGKLGPAWGWDLGFKTTNIDAVESDSGGFPIVISGIKDKDNKDILPSMANQATQIAGGYFPTHGDDTPLLMLGANMTPENEELFAKNYPSQLAESHLKKTTGISSFTTPATVNTPNMPSSKVTSDIKLPLLIAESFTPSPDDIAYTMLPPEVRDMPIRNYTDLEAIFSDNIETLIEIGKEHPVLSARSKTGNPLTNFPRQLSAKNSLFSEANVREVMAWAKTQVKEDGTPKYKTAGDYLSLFTELAVQGTNNLSSSSAYQNYNRNALDEERKVEKTDSTLYDKFATQYRIQPILTRGEKRGLILWNEKDTMFTDIALDLVDAGFNLIRDKQTSQVFARLPEEQVDTNKFDIVASKTLQVTSGMPAIDKRKLQKAAMKKLTIDLTSKPKQEVLQKLTKEGKLGYAAYQEYITKEAKKRPITKAERTKLTELKRNETPFLLRSARAREDIVEPLRKWWQTSSPKAPVEGKKETPFLLRSADAREDIVEPLRMWWQTNIPFTEAFWPES